MYVYTYRTRFLKNLIARRCIYVCRIVVVFLIKGVGKKEDVKGKCCVKFEGGGTMENIRWKEKRERNKNCDVNWETLISKL